MKVGIMQPYILPYIGYFQLLQAVDTFIIYEDVNFIKQGWINRNRILLNGSDYMFNIILKGASSYKKINEIEVVADNHKLIATIEQAYRKAPFFAQTYPVLTNILMDKEPNLARFLTNSLLDITNYLGINVSIRISSEIDKDTSLKGEDKIIDICRQLKANNYINAIGGQELYSKENFTENGLVLNFIQSKPLVYPQFNNIFIPGLSIIDVMMFNSQEQIKKYLNDYQLI